MIVVDTDVLAELLRPEPDAGVLGWLSAQRRGELCTTTIAEAEIAVAIASLPKGRRRDALGQAVARLMGEGLGGRVFPLDRAAAAAYGEVVAGIRPGDEGDGVPGYAFLQVVAIARARAIGTIATRERPRFVLRDLKIVNPWSA